MNDTPETRLVAEESQRNTARMAERDAELVAAVAMGCNVGMAMGEARARQEKE